jgi:hypothetical protein
VQFFPGNSADGFLRSSLPFAARSGQQATPQVTPNREPRETAAPADSPDARLLGKVADADKAYFAKNNRYPVSFPDLVREGLLQMQDSQGGPNHRLSMQAFVPAVSDLPGDILVAYIYDSSTSTYTALFGDWSIKTVPADDWQIVRMRSSQARRKWVKPATP